MTMLTLASVPLFLISKTGRLTLAISADPLSGLLTGSVHSIIVVIAQPTIRGGLPLHRVHPGVHVFGRGARHAVLRSAVRCVGIPAPFPDDVRAGAGGRARFDFHLSQTGFSRSLLMPKIKQLIVIQVFWLQEAT